MTDLRPAEADRGAERGADSGADREGGTVEVLLRRLDPGLPVPSYARPGDAGVDLSSAEEVRLRPGERALVRTGVAIALPSGYAAFVHPRSGLAARCGLSIVNAPGTVDAGYRGELAVNLINLDPDQPVVIARGDRIAQLVVQRVERAAFREVAELPTSVRGEGGHGSTGGHGAAAGHGVQDGHAGRQHGHADEGGHAGQDGGAAHGRS